MPTTLPEVFGRYRIVRKLGEGGMGVVYLADDVPLRRPVALKIPHFRDREDAKVIERFLREARLAAQIVHPNLCPIYDVGAIDGVHYLAMAYIEGQPLSQLIDPEQPWPVHRTLEVVRDLALLMQVLHERKIIHRDLKPGNVMVRPDGSLVLMDFGLARALDSGSQRLTGTMIVGTPSYMAPEQIEANPSTHSEQSDIYALGVILFQLLTGQCPFQGSTMEVFAQVLHAPPPTPSSLRTGIDPGLDRICLAALAKSAKARPASMKVVAAALAEYLQNAPSVPVDAIRVICAGCDKLVKIPQTRPGKKLFCPRCKTPLGSKVIPPASDTPSKDHQASPLPTEVATLESSQSLTSIHSRPQPSRLRWLLTALCVVGIVSAWATTANLWEQIGRLVYPGAAKPEEMTNSLGMKFVKIPSGTFFMGALPDEEPDCKDERPRHEVEITQPFYLGLYEVTQEEYAKVMGKNPSAFSAHGSSVQLVQGLDTKRFAVENVSWLDAESFCRTLSELPAEKQSGRSYRLPSEAEWEYACRAGQNDAPFHFGNELDYTMANFDSRLSYQAKNPPDIARDARIRPYPRQTLSVGFFDRPNRWGLYDMHGNVREWCQDYYSDVYYMASPKKDPLCPPPVLKNKASSSGSDNRTIRGGSWESYAKSCRCAKRFTKPESWRDELTGFRVVCIIEARPK